MISTITTTHAVPQKLLPARAPYARIHLAICPHCFQVLGAAGNRHALESEHICKQKLTDRQPAVPVPFN